VEEEYQSSKRNVVAEQHALAVFTCFTAGVILASADRFRETIKSSADGLLIVVSVLWCTIMTVMWVCNRYVPAALLQSVRSQRTVIEIFLLTLVWLLMNPLLSASFGVCHLGEESLDPGVLEGLPLCCKQLRSGGAPIGALAAGILSPFLLTIACGLRWSAVLGISVSGFAALIIYVVVFMIQTEDTMIRTYDHPVLLLSALSTAMCISLYFSYQIARQDREKFVWRKIALSEAKLEHERTFNAFLCHEIRY
jgi:hypothetical protein